ncbi:hypothetical protein A6E15_12340 [Natrinema saccharevitans]|uniref:DUF8108 domain-containing protein n=1 Tax=Natrinema saccharevitans TaxID=301967 RepID=A0A1S8AYE3_9EURY|nr:hypothetical protein [Natrinema saccharevitans]OLZ41725.1 hypothetical protein A6E15_12340 [Natrinema saccharevitans]
MSTRPDDVFFRLRVETFALLRKLLPVASLAGALVGPLYRLEASIAMWVSPVLLLGVLAGIHLVNGLPLYPAHIFGIEYRYEDESLPDGRRDCVRCGALAETGTHRRYARQVVVLGIPLYTLEWGANDFCDGCSPVTGVAGSTTDRAASPASAANGSSNTDGPRNRQGSAAEHTDEGDDGPERARRVEPNDETTALELGRAFDRSR